MSQTRWLERAVDALDISLLVVSGERRVVFANAAAHKLFGMLSGELMGASIERLVSPERRGELRNIDDVLSGGSARKVRSVLKREDGARVDVTMVLEPCFDDLMQVTGVSIRYYDAPQHSLRPTHATKPPLGMQHEAFPTTPFAISSLPSPPISGVPSPAPEAPRISQSRLSAVQEDRQRTQLIKLTRNLQWLHDRLSVPAELTSLDEPRERARAMVVLAEAMSTAQELLSAAEEREEIPAAPRVPRV